MKKTYLSLLSFLILLSISTPIFGYEEANGIILNGNELNLDVNPIIKNGRTLVPVRALFESLGFEVDWDNKSRSLTGRKDSSIIKLAIDNSLQGNSFNGVKIFPDEPATIINSRTLVPVRLVSELMDLEVKWDNLSRNVFIYDKNSIYHLEFEVLRLINIERTRAGINPLKLSSNLSKVARLKSQDMNDKNYLDHISPTYGSPYDMMISYSIKFSSGAENIAQGYTTSESVVKAWMDSEGHKRNILNPNFDTLGVGYAGKNYWTQMFIKSD